MFRKAVILTIATVIAVFAYTVWRARQMEAFVAALKDPALGLTYTSIETGGWPYRMVVTLKGAEARLLPPRPFVLKAEALTLYAQPWSLHHVIIESPALELVAAGGSRITARDARSSLVIEKGAAQRFVVETAAVTIDRPAGRMLSARKSLLGLRRSAPGTPALTDGTPGLHLPRLADGSIEFDGVTLGKGTRLDAMAAGLVLTGNRIPHWQAESLQSWRKDGGELLIKPVTILNGNHEVKGSATLALDAALKPLLAGTIEGADTPGWVADMAGLTPQERATLQAAKTALPLSISIQDGILRAGPVPLTRFQGVLP